MGAGISGSQNSSGCKNVLGKMFCEDITVACTIARQVADGSFAMYHPVKCLPTRPQCYKQLVAVIKTRIITMLAPEIPVKWKVTMTFGFGFAKSILHGILIYSILCTLNEYYRVHPLPLGMSSLSKMLKMA